MEAMAEEPVDALSLLLEIQSAAKTRWLTPTEMRDYVELASQNFVGILNAPPRQPRCKIMNRSLLVSPAVLVPSASSPLDVIDSYEANMVGYTLEA